MIHDLMADLAASMKEAVRVFKRRRWLKKRMRELRDTVPF